MYVYEIAYKGDSKIRITLDEFDLIQDILITKENITYSELQSLEWERSEALIEIINQYSKGQNRQMKEQNKKVKH